MSDPPSWRLFINTYTCTHNCLGLAEHKKAFEREGKEISSLESGINRGISDSGEEQNGVECSRHGARVVRR